MVNTNTYLEANWSYKPKGSGQNQQWYQSKSSDKHFCYNLNMFCNIKENFLISNLENQKKFLFTYGMGEVIIKPVFQAYLIPGVYFAPEVSLNILSIDLLKQQGFEVVSEGDRYRLEYMFKEPTGNILDLNKLRQMQNNFLEDYFEGLNENKDGKIDEMVRIEEDMNSSEVHTFHEFVAFLNLIKNDELVSKGLDLYRDRFVKVLKWFYNHYLQRQLPGPIPPIIHGIPIHLFDLYKLLEYMGGYLSVHFGQEFDALAEILGLTRKDGEDIRKCYMVYLDIFISYYKTSSGIRSSCKKRKRTQVLSPTNGTYVKQRSSTLLFTREGKLEHFWTSTKKKKFAKNKNLHTMGMIKS
ncbi:ARID DNA-binding domain-containing protein [Tanacetum coccineum]